MDNSLNCVLSICYSGDMLVYKIILVNLLTLGLLVSLVTLGLAISLSAQKDGLLESGVAIGI